MVLDVRLEVRERQTFLQLDGYDNALQQGVDFRRFFEWFREREDWENEAGSTPAADAVSSLETARRRLEGLSAHDFKDSREVLRELSSAIQTIQNLQASDGDLQLNAVRQAIERFMPGFANLKVRRKPSLHMSVDKHGERLNVSQLSQGEKSLMALVGDIARRLAIMNPGLNNPLLGEGVVLIDEVDMHLHPRWARDIVDRLRSTFPHCQFVLTTHSPLVISDCKDVLIYSLNDGEVTEVPSQFGQDANTVLLDVMDTHVRNAEIAGRLNDLLDLIQDGKLAEARDLLSSLKQQLPPNHLELSKASLLLSKREQRAKN